MENRFEVKKKTVSNRSNLIVRGNGDKNNGTGQTSNTIVCTDNGQIKW
ncbi:hypothetical protein BN8_p06899 (plasmid) [Fibrisoma limi BUZ 3]|uniref:Uncharacterized protein n=1 Tax=Fibrisoma limi BUZ 3 TaxID=1185876 RepID=I2GU89_9BACT|nr:hypothetical protein BN8_p06899 [Fibrisoma limi BUZ 3]